jgi:hypothetical protein
LASGDFFSLIGDLAFGGDEEGVVVVDLIDLGDSTRGCWGLSKVTDLLLLFGEDRVKIFLKDKLNHKYSSQNPGLKRGVFRETFKRKTFIHDHVFRI